MEGEEGVQSYGEVDPKKELEAIERRLKEIDAMEEIDQDAAEERRILERKRENLLKTISDMEEQGL